MLGGGPGQHSVSPVAGLRVVALRRISAGAGAGVRFLSETDAAVTSPTGGRRSERVVLQVLGRLVRRRDVRQQSAAVRLCSEHLELIHCQLAANTHTHIHQRVPIGLCLAESYETTSMCYSITCQNVYGPCRIAY